jgi:hypothetical protein
MKNTKFSDYLRIAKFDHWIKQLSVFPGVVFAWFLIDDTRTNVGILNIFYVSYQQVLLLLQII